MLQFKRACLTVYVILSGGCGAASASSPQRNLFPLARDEAPLLGQSHARVLRSHRVRLSGVPLMLVSSQVLLILLETVCRMPNSLSRLV